MERPSRLLKLRKPAKMSPPLRGSRRRGEGGEAEAEELKLRLRAEEGEAQEEEGRIKTNTKPNKKQNPGNSRRRVGMDYG